MMKKITSLKLTKLLIGSGLLLMAGNPAFAKQVPQTDAKTVAENFFRQHSASAVTGELTYTSLDNLGRPLYYVFNMNGNSGFVIVSADDVAKPIIGYSTEQGFQKPDPRSSAAFWLSKREGELTALKNNTSITASAAVTEKWNNYLMGAQVAGKTATVTSIVVAPLVLTKWNQSPFYNADCPGNSVTGCVATTMAQIMKYWSYPTQGTGSSSYCDCTASGFPNNYGTLSANYGTTTYNWNNMPLTVSSANTDVAQLMFHCGVSVHMNYDPTGSSAAVISSDSPNSAQNAYVNYFNYDPNAINGAHRSSYNDNDWKNLIKGDLDISRPVQYVGYGSEGGHTWVCDGYDSNDLFHMNWGWGGSSDGYYDIDNLAPTGTGIDFNNWQEGLFGIVPQSSNGLDAGIVSVSPITNACTAPQYAPTVKIRNFGYDDLNSCTLNYKIDNGPVQSVQWSGSLVTGQAADLNIPGLSLSNGAHVLTCYISNPNNGTDINASNDQNSYSFAVYSSGTLPISEGFEVPSQTDTHWSVIPSQNGSDWAFTTQGFSGGAQSMMVNNLTNHAGNTSILMGLNNYDFSTVSQPYFHFKVAYQQKATTNADKLSLEISNDCGNTWWVKWSKQGTALATNTNLSSSPFMPAVSDFVEYAIPGVISHNTIFRWVFKADPTAPGNNVYLDDINMGEGATVGIQEISAVESSLALYPNPANGETFLKFNLDNASVLEVNVTDIAGRTLLSVPKTNYNTGEQLISINKENSLAPGVYMVTVTANGVRSSRKLIVGQ